MYSLVISRVDYCVNNSTSTACSEHRRQAKARPRSPDTHHAWTTTLATDQILHHLQSCHPCAPYLLFPIPAVPDASHSRRNITSDSDYNRHRQERLSSNGQNAVRKGDVFRNLELSAARYSQKKFHTIDSSPLAPTVARMLINFPSRPNIVVVIFEKNYHRKSKIEVC